LGTDESRRALAYASAMSPRALLLIACASVLVAAALLVPTARSSPRRSAPGVHALPVPALPVPAAGRPVDTSHPNRVVGDGAAASCTSAAVVAAVRAGGIIRFSCGPAAVTIRMSATAKVRNTSRQVVLDGGGLVTLSGEGRRRVLYLDTCPVIRRRCGRRRTARIKHLRSSSFRT